MNAPSVTAPLTLKPGIRTWPLDVSTGRDRYLVETGEQRRFEISNGVYQLIELLQSGAGNADRLALELRQRGIEDASGAGVLEVVRRQLIPHGIVEPLPGESAAVVAAPRPRASYLKVQIPLFSAQRLAPLTSVLSGLFRPPVMALLLLLSALAHGYFYAFLLPGFAWSAATLPASQSLLILLALNLTTFFHELGHASACRSFDCEHGKIGWGIYIFLPVLYTDVSATWRLGRYQRALIDAAGMYFELIAAVVLTALLLVTGEPLLVYMFLFLDLSILTSLNPILRRDGYWLLADLSGQPHLRAASLEAMRAFTARLRGHRLATPLLSSLPTWLRRTLYLYTGATVAFSIYFLDWMIELLAFDIGPALPLQARTLVAALSHQPPELLTAGSALLHLLLSLIFGALILSAAWSFVAGFFRWLRGFLAPAAAPAAVSSPSLGATP